MQLIMKWYMVCHNPYFNRWFSAIPEAIKGHCNVQKVTILILIDGFLQSVRLYPIKNRKESHNPYFNRWFSAIKHCKQCI